MNDLSQCKVWGNLMPELSFRALDEEMQKVWTQTVWALLRGRGETVNRANVMAQYNILKEE